MLSPRIYISAVGSALLCVAMAVQAIGAQDKGQSPSIATATAGSDQKLTVGQNFMFQLKFDRAPEGYGKGRIIAHFSLQLGPGEHPMTISGEDAAQLQTAAVTELHDGQAIYIMNIPIAFNMAPGRWKLTNVSFGQVSNTDLPVREDVSFDVVGVQPIRVKMSGPTRVEAGRTYEVTVTVTDFPKNSPQECSLSLGVRLMPEVTPVGMIDLDYKVIEPNQSTYTFRHDFESDFPSTVYTAQVMARARNTKYREASCWVPEVGGDQRMPLTVAPSPYLIPPTAVAVKINPSQVDLLKAQAAILKSRADNLIRDAAQADQALDAATLQKNIQDALHDVDQTEVVFKPDNSDRGYLRVVNVFFDDIRASYGEALRTVAHARSDHDNDASFRTVSMRAGSGSKAATKAVVTSLTHNANAYSIAANTESLTFNLDVYSSPQQAIISYKLRGDDYTVADHGTDWEIKNLPRAVYEIKVHLDGYEDQEKSFDAMSDSRTSIKFDLKRKPSTK